MAEVGFDRTLERLFAEAPEMGDREAFAERVRRRLERGWAARRVLIAVAGAVGGVIGGSQLIMSNLLSRADFTSTGAASASARALGSGVRQVAPQIDWLFARPAGVETLWIAAVVAVVAIGFAITRIIEEI